MTAKLPADLLRALEQAGDRPLTVEDPQTKRVFVVADARRYEVVRRPDSENSWTDQKNERRCALIHKQFTAGISQAEDDELAQLQEELSAYRKQTVPLPYDAVDALRAALAQPNGTAPSPKS
jgi:hypothetical protein